MVFLNTLFFTSPILKTPEISKSWKNCLQAHNMAEIGILGTACFVCDLYIQSTYNCELSSNIPLQEYHMIDQTYLTWLNWLIRFQLHFKRGMRSYCDILNCLR